ncbi:MAG: hypothetical protein KKH92_01260, partial [Firmicutes bacterium]|nr:hypothetical protein [Bacillota bacterium]
KYGFKSVDEMVRRNQLNEIVAIYKEVFEKKGKDLNLTSTVLIHYPLNESKLYYGQRVFFNPLSYDEHLKKVKTITILTGDALFDSEMLDRMSDELTKHNNIHTIFQIPHHGSKKNWDSLTHPYKFAFNHYVIPFGLGNKYHHPHKDVINELMTFKILGVSLVTEIQPLHYYIA